MAYIPAASMRPFGYTFQDTGIGERETRDRLVACIGWSVEIARARAIGRSERWRPESGDDRHTLVAPLPLAGALWMPDSCVSASSFPSA